MAAIPEGAILDAGLAADATPIAGPIATGASALPADLPPPGAPVALPDLPGGIPNVPGPEELRAPVPVAPVVAAPGAPVAPGAPAAPIPPELQGVADAANAQATAAEDAGAANAAAADAKAKAEADARVQHQLDAQEAADLRAAHAQAAQAAEDRTQKALVAARDAKIPDFWAGREGARVSAALMVGLGGAAAGLLGTSKNGAADIIQNNVDSYYRREKEKIDNLYKYAEGQGKAQDDLRMRHAAELAELQVQHGATNLAIADHIKEIEAASQGRINIAEANAIMAKVLEEGQKSILAGRKTLAEIEIDKARAEIERRKSKGGAGGGGTAYDAFRAAVLAGKEDVGALANKAGIKGPQIEAQRTAILEEADKLKKLHGGVGAGEEKLIARNPDGSAAGLATSTKQVYQINKELRTIPEAIRKLEKLRDEMGTFTTSRDPLFHNAVLAVASTTQAGSTDANVAHEKGTLTNSIGLPSKDAINAKIAELQNQLADTQSQLNPLPDNYIDRKGTTTTSLAVPAAEGGAKAPVGMTAAQAATLEKLAKMGFKAVQ
jgi:hypothetical protein